MCLSFCVGLSRFLCGNLYRKMVDLHMSYFIVNLAHFTTVNTCHGSHGFPPYIPSHIWMGFLCYVDGFFLRYPEETAGSVWIASRRGWDHRRRSHNRKGTGKSEGIYYVMKERGEETWYGNRLRYIKSYWIYWVIDCVYFISVLCFTYYKHLVDTR